MIYYYFFYVAPAFITEPNDHVTRESDVGLTVVLNCTARGIPTPTFTWSPNNRNIIISTSSTDGEGYTFVTSILTITNIQRSDFIYSCIASNLGGLDSRNFSLTINCKLYDVQEIIMYMLLCEYSNSPLKLW